MALEPVREDGLGLGGHQHPAGSVALPAGLRQRQGVRVGAVERAATTQAVRLFGRVAADENRVFSLNAAMEGSIHDLSGVTTGSLVRRGQRLGAFFMPELRQALQAFMTALDVVDLDPARLNDTGHVVVAGSTPNRNAQYVVERLRSLGVSDEQLAEIKRRREIPYTIDIRSPADGVVLARNVTVGQKFDKGMEWFRIASLDRVWIVADLLEGDAPLARPGATARITIPGRPEVLVATVSRVPPLFDAASRTLKLRLEVENPGGLLRPDMYADVELSVARPATLTVPVDAVVDAGLRKTVFVEAGEGVFEPRAVETGWRAGGRVEVVRGLEAGERIVLSGVFLVDSESQLRAAALGAPLAPAAAPAGAGAAAPAPAGTARDPVCHMAVDEAQARAAGRVAEHAGRTHFFCSDGCRARFAAGPERFTDAAAGHAPAAVQARAEVRP
jgi:Cu(I)/Ag(I) efflux system membrane fusion protein